MYVQAVYLIVLMIGSGDSSENVRVQTLSIPLSIRSTVKVRLPRYHNR